MEDKRKYHIIIGSKAYFDASLPDFSEEDEVDTFLELVKLFPDTMFLDSGFSPDNFLLIQFAQRIAENMIQNKIIDKIRGFVAAEPCKLIDKNFLDVSDMAVILPDGIKPFFQFSDVFRFVESGTHIMSD